HEAAGIIEAVGPDVTGVAVGDYVVIAWRAPCGVCRSCRRGRPWYCFDSRNASQPMTLVDGTPLSPALGIGAFADKTLVAAGQCVPVDRRARPEAAGLIGCGVMAGFGAAVNTGGVTRGDTVAVFGCGPVGQFAIRSALMMGAGRVVAIDRIPERLAMAAQAGAEIVNFDKEEPYDRLNQLTGGRGPDSCIDAVGMEAHGSGAFDAVLDRGEAALGIATDRIHAMRQCITNCRCGGTVSLSGVYGGFLNHVNMGAAFQKGLTMRMGQCNVLNYMDKLMRMIEEGKFDPSFVITHTVALGDAPKMYEIFKKKQDGCIKVVMKPNG
ncbi:MAG TPA: zinc-binding dehydrogenase, partial [Rhizomicrobium sp.]